MATVGITSASASRARTTETERPAENSTNPDPASALQVLANAERDSLRLVRFERIWGKSGGSSSSTAVVRTENAGCLQDHP